MDKEIIEKIKYLRDVKKLLFRQIGEMLGLGRKTVSRVYYNNFPEKNRIHACKLDECYELIAYWFHEYPSLKAIQIWTWLKERSIHIGYTTVVKYTKQLRAKKQKVYFPLEFLPGEEAQVDWFSVNHAYLGKLYGFAMILSFSRMMYVCFFQRSSFEFFIEGHLKAFEYFNGIPSALRYDNLKSVVLKRQPLTYNPVFLQFARYYGFEIRLCNIAAGNEKGRVERAIRSIRDTFLNVAVNCREMKAFCANALEWMERKNKTIHRATGKAPVELFKEEKLRTLPLNPWNNEMIIPAKKPNKTGFITFDTNYYSVPDYLIREIFILHITVSQVRIYDSKDKCIATHPRSFKRNQTFFNPLHRSFKQLSSEAKRERIFSVIRKLDWTVQSFLEKNLQSGEDPYTSAYLIFKLLSGHSREMILSAIRELLKQHIYSIMALYKILKVMPDSEPVQPQNQTLLNIDYKPRSLEEYHS